MGFLVAMRRTITDRRFGSVLRLAGLLPGLFLSLSKERNYRWNISKAAGECGGESAAISDSVLKRFWPDSATKAVA